MKETVHVPVQMVTLGTTVKVSPFFIIIYNCAVDRE